MHLNRKILLHLSTSTTPGSEKLELSNTKHAGSPPYQLSEKEPAPPPCPPPPPRHPRQSVSCHAVLKGIVAGGKVIPKLDYATLERKERRRRAFLARVVGGVTGAARRARREQEWEILKWGVSEGVRVKMREGEVGGWMEVLYAS